MFFKYECLSQDGSRVTGVIEAKDKASAIEELKRVFPIILFLGEKKTKLKTTKVPRRELIAFTDIMSICINAGLPIIKSLELASENIKNKNFKEVLNLVISSIRSGSLLSEAIMVHPSIFDELYIGIIKSGEASGKLGKSLENLAKYLEKSFNISSKIKSALIYPLIILSVAIGVVLLFLTLIVPKFSEIYSSYSTELPQITQITITLGNFVKDNILWILLSTISLVFILNYLYLRLNAFKKLIQDMIITLIPPLGNFLIKRDLEKFSRVIGMMISNGVMILEALNTSSKVVNLVSIREAIEFAISEVEKGKLISEVFSEYSFLPPIFVQMIKVGEETGELDKTLSKMAEFYSFELERQSEALVSSLSPIMIVIVGLIVAFLVLSLFMPMFSLQQILIR